MSTTSSSATLPASTKRRRQRPYLNWLERSRDHWKRKAVAARADAARLHRRIDSLTSSRDHWRAQTRQLRNQLRLAQSDLLEKNASRS